MPNQLTPLLHFFEAYGTWIALGSIIVFLVSIAAIPLIVARIPIDYFNYEKRHKLTANSRHPLIQALITGFKNLLGAVMVLAGIIMLFTPGQGLISILFGLMIMNYPGKYRLERWFINRPLIWKTINHLRKKQNKAPLLPLDTPTD